MAGKGFNHSPNAGEFRRNTSWGRTRQPKNIINSNHSTPASVTLTAAEDQSAGYNTENQRFLHVNHIVVAGNGDGAVTIQVQAWMHASGQWGTISSLSSTISRKHDVVEIAGADRVRFVADGITGTETCTIFPACSSF